MSGSAREVAGGVSAVSGAVTQVPAASDASNDEVTGNRPRKKGCGGRLQICARTTTYCKGNAVGLSAQNEAEGPRAAGGLSPDKWCWLRADTWHARQDSNVRPVG